MIFGHQKIRQILQGQIKNDKLSHAYLFFGPEGIGKKMVAVEFARAILCLEAPKESDMSDSTGQAGDGESCANCDSCRLFEAGTHPDFQLTKPKSEENEKSGKIKEISISFARQIIGWNRLKPAVSFRKVVIIDNSSSLTGGAQNAFLKSLEEPSGFTVFILLASRPEDLLETVVSRCRKVKFSSLTFDDFKKALGCLNMETARLEELYFIFSGRPGPARNFTTPEGQKKLDGARMEFLKMFGAELAKRYQFSENLAKNEESFLKTIDLWRLVARDMIFAKTGLSQAITNRFMEKNITKEAQSHQLDKLLRIFKLLNRLSFSLKETNLNPRLALDWVMTEL